MDKEQEQQIAENQIDDTETGWDSEGQEADEGYTEEGGEEAGEKQEDAQETKQEDKPAEDKKPEQKTESDEERFKRLRDQRAVAIGEAETLRRLARKMEADGFLDRDEIAQELGKTRGEVDALIDRSAPPEPGEATFAEQQAKAFDTEITNSQKAIVRMYGDVEAQRELVAAFAWAANSDPVLDEQRRTLPGDELVFLALDEGKKALEDYRTAKTAGGEKALLKRVRELEAQLASKGTTQTPATSAPEADKDEQEEDIVEERPKPRNAREAHLAMLLG